MRGGMFATGVGRLTRDPTLRFTPQNLSVCEFSIACNYEVGSTKDTTFVDCVAWRGLADIISKWAKKGSGVFVRGRLQQQEWQGRDGSKRTRMQLVVNDFSFLGVGPSDDGQPDAGQPATPAGSSDTLPF